MKTFQIIETNTKSRTSTIESKKITAKNPSAAIRKYFSEVYNIGVEMGMTKDESMRCVFYVLCQRGLIYSAMEL